MKSHQEWCTFTCCKLCHGLFASRHLYRKHVAQCSSQPDLSNCEYFACPRCPETFQLLQSKNKDTSGTTREDSGSLSVSNENDPGSTQHFIEDSVAENVQTRCDDIFEKVVKREKAVHSPGKTNKILSQYERRKIMKDSEKNDVLNKDLEVSKINEHNKKTNSETLQGSLDDAKYEKYVICPDCGTAKKAGRQFMKHVCTAKSMGLTSREACTSYSTSNEGKQSCEESGDDLHDDSNNLEKKASTQKMQMDASRKKISLYDKFEHCKQIHNGKVVFVCDFCARSFNTVSYLGRHMRCHNDGNDGKWKCQQCDFSTLSKAQLKCHTLTHSRPVMCDICTKRFSRVADLRLHMLNHEASYPIACTVCNYRCKKADALVSHMRKHTGSLLECQIEGCDYKTAYRSALNAHSTTHSDTYPFHCHLCEFKTKTRAGFKLHLKIHGNEKDYKCPYCEFYAVTKNRIVRHMTTHTKEKVFFCDHCQYASASSSNLKVHLMQHYKVKPWHCSVCDFKTLTKQKALTHISNKHKDVKDPLSVLTHLGLQLQVDLNHYKLSAEQQLEQSLQLLKQEETTDEVLEMEYVAVADQDGEINYQVVECPDQNIHVIAMSDEVVDITDRDVNIVTWNVGGATEGGMGEIEATEEDQGETGIAVDSIGETEAKNSHVKTGAAQVSIEGAEANEDDMEGTENDINDAATFF